ncbi:MAG: type II toxin-antitoxin system HicB family antitoxin [Candidatus Pacebacteria bacterium]|nr:type II toxin-antitoxin system HicB family antitoxin [Candidatus Paceibacterota bacterium]PIR60065.1 MAG: hypothetical protein COU67_03955 [Candidatus Pacebacteria bacterium CG10_big_fil_rev_8_21_14_0_10_44_54]
MKQAQQKTLSTRGLHALIWQEEDVFVSKCVELEVASQGATEQEALANLEEALQLFFENEPVKASGLTNLRIVPL